MQPMSTFIGIAHPWMCDVMGHVNVRHYAAMFDDAGFHFLGELARDEPEGTGWADVRVETEFLREISPGTLITIRSQMVRIGRSSITYRHEMKGTLDDIARATALVTTVRFDLAARRAAPLSGAILTRAAALIPAQ